MLVENIVAVEHTLSSRIRPCAAVYGSHSNLRGLSPSELTSELTLGGSGCLRPIRAVMFILKLIVGAYVIHKQKM